MLEPAAFDTVVLAFGFGGTPGFWEILLVLAVMLLLFGKRLPEVGRSLGRGLVEFKKGLKGIEDDANAVDVEVVRNGKKKQQKKGEADGNRNLAAGDDGEPNSAAADQRREAEPVRTDESK